MTLKSCIHLFLLGFRIVVVVLDFDRMKCRPTARLVVAAFLVVVDRSVRAITAVVGVHGQRGRRRMLIFIKLFLVQCITKVQCPLVEIVAGIYEARVRVVSVEIAVCAAAASRAALLRMLI